MTKDQKASDAFRTLITDAKRIIDNQNYAGFGITLVEDIYRKYADYYTVDANGNHVVDSNLTRAQLVAAMEDVHYAVSEVLKRMEALNNK